KQIQRNKKNARTVDIKQMRFGLKISGHDLGVKLSKVSDFLAAGHKVKITIVYRGRELAHRDIGFKLADKVIADFGDQIIVDQMPQFAGKQLNFVIRSNPASRSRQTSSPSASSPEQVE
ncbi:MAG TPA: translation initiation factor IF-3, partial [Candidatus Saccharimonadales bacterium]|nr:translation initiation factor IF-3 [Candidatus Saccharimonadales bacterium]